MFAKASACLVARPERKAQPVGCFNEEGGPLRFRSFSEGDVRGPSGKILGHAYSMGSPGSEITVRQAEQVVSYFLSAWPDEDVVTFCQENTKTLEDLVDRAYRQFP